MNAHPSSNAAVGSDACAACGRPQPWPPPILCECGARLDPSTQAAVAAAAAALQRKARRPPRLWLGLWLLSVPIQLQTALAFFGAQYRPTTFNIHSGYGALLYFSAIAGLAHPCFIVWWLITGPPLRALPLARRIAWDLAVLATILLAAGTLLGFFRQP